MPGAVKVRAESTTLDADKSRLSNDQKYATGVIPLWYYRKGIEQIKTLVSVGGE